MAEVINSSGSEMQDAAAQSPERDAQMDMLGILRGAVARCRSNPQPGAVLVVTPDVMERLLDDHEKLRQTRLEVDLLRREQRRWELVYAADVDERARSIDESRLLFADGTTVTHRVATRLLGMFHAAGGVNCVEQCFGVEDGDWYTITIQKRGGRTPLELCHLAEGQRDAYIEALTASGDTKAAYHGEFSFPVTRTGEDGEPYETNEIVPWTTIKEVMAAIKERAEERFTPLTCVSVVNSPSE